MSGDRTKDGIRTVLFMIVVTFAYISILTIVHLATRDTIKKNRSIAEKKSMLYVAGLDVPDSNKAVERLFTKSFRQEGRYFTYIGKDGKSGYVIRLSGPGLWGEIVALVAVREDEKTIAGIDFIKQGETPGLGARIDENWFREQFRGKKALSFKIMPEKTNSDRMDEFDAITGATITTKGIKQIVDSVQPEMKRLIGNDKADGE